MSHTPDDAPSAHSATPDSAPGITPHGTAPYGGMGAEELLDNAARELAPAENPLVDAISAGTAPREVFAAVALEQRHVIPSDRTSFGHLARRAADAPPTAAFFDLLAEGETVALTRLAGLTSACGLTEKETSGYEPRPGCQGYPAYVSWLALHAEPVDVVIALTANFAAWGRYCATVSQAMREHYAFGAEARAFFDFFAEPGPELDDRARAAVRHGLETGAVTLHLAHRYGRLLQAYEEMFWGALLPPE
ncbi:transcriptional regulator [Streptomyces sp. NPDC003077]|uniref:transcriptional regulator n=1 Tax=Streptomyces sp. NPDC003077 TaxID=3154443 RepID=UPI0033AD840D